MSSRSKGFIEIENKYKYSNEYEIAVSARNSLIQIYSSGKLPYILYRVIVLLGAKVGIDSDGTLNSKEKNLVDFVMGDIFRDEMDDIYNKLSDRIFDIDFFLVDKISKLGADIAIPFLDYILCFAYIDGVIDDCTADILDDIFNIEYIDDFFKEI